MSAFIKYGWIPYFVLCFGIMMLFGTEVGCSSFGPGLIRNFEIADFRYLYIEDGSM